MQITEQKTVAHRERGFTLIELMVVVGIIAMLALVLIPNFINARNQAATAACESNLNAIAVASEMFFADQQAYPATGTVTAALFTANGISYFKASPIDPSDPTRVGKYAFTNTTANGQPSYTVLCPGTHATNTLAKLTGYAQGQTKILYTGNSGLSSQ